MGTRPTLSPTAYILIVLLLGALAVGNYFVLQQITPTVSVGGAGYVYQHSGDALKFALYFFIGAPLFVGLLLLLILPRLVKTQAAEQDVVAAPVHEEQKEPAPQLPSAKPSSDAAVQLLGLFQRDGRLVDFLREDIQAYDDAQIGAAVRTIHESCRQVLAEHLPVEPVLSGQEGDDVSVPEGFDPSAIRLTGNVSGEPPFRGTLQHAGWRAAQVKLPEQPVGQDPNIVAPAEVEIS